MVNSSDYLKEVHGDPTNNQLLDRLTLTHSSHPGRHPGQRGLQRSILAQCYPIKPLLPKGLRATQLQSRTLREMRGIKIWAPWQLACQSKLKKSGSGFMPHPLWVPYFTHLPYPTTLPPLRVAMPPSLIWSVSTDIKLLFMGWTEWKGKDGMWWKHQLEAPVCLSLDADTSVIPALNTEIGSAL